MWALFAALTSAVFFYIYTRGSETCRIIDRMYYPENGGLECVGDAEQMTCTRTCQFPLVPAEPEFVVEHCGPDTQFAWSHTLRHNSSILPPCEMISKCVDIEETPKPRHGHFDCRDVEWANTKTCDLVCDQGYMPASAIEVFCGPTSNFRWSHEWSKLKNGGCERAPVSVVITTLESSCHRIIQEVHSNDMTSVFDEVNKDLEGREMWKLVNWRSECFSQSHSEEEIKYYFNFKDLCNNGTCEDACNALKMQDMIKSDLCYAMCSKVFKQSVEALTQMRNITLHHIAKTLAATQPHIENIQYGFQSLEVDVGDTEYQIC